MTAHLYSPELELVEPEGLDPDCEVLQRCDGETPVPHAPHWYECGDEAAWMASWVCVHGHPSSLYACDPCYQLVHDQPVDTHDGLIRPDWIKL